MKLVSKDDPILQTIVKPFDFKNPPTDPKKLADDLIAFMCENNALGLAANQVGLPYHAFAIGSPANPEECSVIFNGNIVSHSDETESLEEGCLTFPGLYVIIKRYSNVRMRITDFEGNTTTNTFDGLTARIMQHEMDHLNGILFTEHASKFHLDRAKRKKKIRDRKK